ncbi:hypothetical protein [Vibrio harveyi]|uniref:hypothetical protein n=1 Tax=Vibrio harveyi TaxID=669 RepID=UPI003BB67246|nr:hypothetical protein [Vibrio harveyi]
MKQSEQDSIFEVSPNRRRKFMAILLGSSVGAVASLSSPKSHAFLGLSPTDLLEMFFEKAGSILMMFIANRFYKNFIEAFDKYTESQKESAAKEYGLLGGTMQNAMDFEVNFEKELYQTELARKTETSQRLCAETQLASVVTQSSKASESNVVNISAGQTHILYDTEFTTVEQYQRSYIELVKSTLDSNGNVSLKALSQIFGTSSFVDVAQAQTEFTLMLADVVPSPRSEHLQWTKQAQEYAEEHNSVPWADWPLEGSLSNAKAAFSQLSDIAKVNMLVEALSFPMARRMPSQSLTQIMFDTLQGAGKNKAQLALNGDLPLLCSAEALLLEVEAKSLEPGYLEEVNQHADLTPASYYFNTQISLQNYIRHQRLKVADLRNTVRAVTQLIDVQSKKGTVND